MTEARPIYGPGRFPKKRGKGLCRGCGEKITDPRRRTWCSHACFTRWEPGQVQIAVDNRDQGICQLCGLDIFGAARLWEITRREKLNENWEAFRKFVNSNPKPRPEYDHITPFSEGGLTVLENMRTLCTNCHKKVTAEWRREKARQRRIKKQPKLELEEMKGE